MASGADNEDNEMKRSKFVNRVLVSSAACALLALPAGTASAAELEYGFEIGAGTSDNITRVPVNETDETIATAGIDLSFVQDGRRVDADIQLDLSYFDYLDNTYDSEVFGSVQAELRLALVPDRIEWVIQDTFGQLEINPFEAATPLNRENVNYFTTGPDLRLRLGSAASLLLFGRLSVTDYEETSLDAERITAGLTLARELSSRNTLSFNAVTERVEFDDPTSGSNYDRHSAYLRYEATGARTRLAAEAGYTMLHDFGDSTDTPLFTLELERDLSPASTLTLSGGIRSTDAADALRGGTPTGAFSFRPDAVSTADPFETRHASIGWRYQAQRTTMTLSGGWEEDAYETDTSLDRDRQILQATLERRLSQTLRLRLSGSLAQSDYGTAGFEDDETMLGLGLSWNASGRLFVELDADSIRHDSSNPLLDWDETRIFLRLAWRSTGGG